MDALFHRNGNELFNRKGRAPTGSWRFRDTKV